ncbi:MAG: HPr family phosphocarrier protein [Gemmataceae bacterium]|nr:HPr family phosphocarrier protein [Gemmataceae bacterium]
MTQAGGGNGGPNGPPPGGGGAVRRAVRITNPYGLHHRVADRFARTAKGYAGAAVAVFNGDQRADGKSLWDLLGLVALPGAEVVLEVSGADAPAAADALAAILAAPGGEDYTI